MRDQQQIRRMAWGDGEGHKLRAFPALWDGVIHGNDGGSVCSSRIRTH